MSTEDILNSIESSIKANQINMLSNHFFDLLKSVMETKSNKSTLNQNLAESIQKEFESKLLGRIQKEQLFQTSLRNYIAVKVHELKKSKGANKLETLSSEIGKLTGYVRHHTYWSRKTKVKEKSQLQPSHAVTIVLVLLLFEYEDILKPLREELKKVFESTEDEEARPSIVNWKLILITNVLSILLGFLAGHEKLIPRKQFKDSVFVTDSLKILEFYEYVSPHITDPISFEKAYNCLSSSYKNNLNKIFKCHTFPSDYHKLYKNTGNHVVNSIRLYEERPNDSKVRRYLVQLKVEYLEYFENPLLKKGAKIKDLFYANVKNKDGTDSLLTIADQFITEMEKNFDFRSPCKPYDTLNIGQIKNEIRNYILTEKESPVGLFHFNYITVIVALFDLQDKIGIVQKKSKSNVEEFLFIEIINNSSGTGRIINNFDEQRFIKML